MGFGLFASSLGNGAHHGDQVLLLLILVVVPLQQGLTDLHSDTVVQLVGCLLVVKHHVCSTRAKNIVTRDSFVWMRSIHPSSLTDCS